MKNKKYIIVICAVILLIAILIGVYIANTSNTEQENNSAVSQSEEADSVSKLEEIYNYLIENPNYTFGLELNETNKMVISRKDENAYVDILDEGDENIYIVSEGNTVLLVPSTKRYYTYQNSQTYLAKVTNNMRELLNDDYFAGTESINGEEYYYEEFSEHCPFIINYKKSIDETETKTRLYFKNNELKYIKTYVGDVEQLLKVSISYNVDDNISFDVPEDYTE